MQNYAICFCKDMKKQCRKTRTQKQSAKISEKYAKHGISRKLNVRFCFFQKIKYQENLKIAIEKNVKMQKKRVTKCSTSMQKKWENMEKYAK